MPDPGAPAWDVGDRPTVKMTYLEYPVYRPPTSKLTKRDGEEVCMPPLSKSEVQARLEVRNSTGWASGRGTASKTYKSLGEYENLPRTGMEVRMMKAESVKKVRVCVPDIEAKSKADAQEVAANAIPLLPDVIARGDVKQMQYVYYQFELTEHRNLVFHLKSTLGDPDIFVSNSCMQPKQDPQYHTWRGANAGDDEILITYDHPRYALGTYMIGIYATQFAS